MLYQIYPLLRYALHFVAKCYFQAHHVLLSFVISRHIVRYTCCFRKRVLSYPQFLPPGTSVVILLLLRGTSCIVPDARFTSVGKFKTLRFSYGYAIGMVYTNGDVNYEMIVIIFETQACIITRGNPKGNTP